VARLANDLNKVNFGEESKTPPSHRVAEETKVAKEEKDQKR